MTPLERLLLEEIPSGTFGGARSLADRTTVTSDSSAAEHCAELLAGLDEHERLRHLHVVATPEEGAA